MRRLDAPSLILGEGPVWTPATGVLSWIDIDGGLVLSAPFDGDALGPVDVRHVGGSVGAAIPISGGRYLVALEAWLGILHPDGRLEKGRPIISANRRLNDGKVDPEGRFVVGSLRRFGGPDGAQELLRLEADGRITVLDDALNLSNGLGWSPDGAWLYHVDSIDRTIYRRAYGDVLGPREAFAVLPGMPDGMTVDAGGRLWVTLLDLHRIDCLDDSGERITAHTIEIPEQRHPASCEFAGPDLDRLIITTGFPRLEQDADLPLRAADDGAILVTDPGARGIPPTPWNEAPLPVR